MRKDIEDWAACNYFRDDAAPISVQYNTKKSLQGLWRELTGVGISTGATYEQIIEKMRLVNSTAIQPREL
jgi:hypothetical protein